MLQSVDNVSIKMDNAKLSLGIIYVHVPISHLSFTITYTTFLTFRRIFAL